MNTAHAQILAASLSQYPGSTMSQTTVIELRSQGLPSAKPDAAPSDAQGQKANESLANDASLERRASAVTVPVPSKKTTAIVISSVTCITTLSTLISGLVTVAIPTMAKDVGLADSLLLW